MLVATGVGVLGASLAAPLAEAATLAPVERQAVFRLQDDAQPSQVGEADDESLDQGAPPAASADDDPEDLDQGSPPVPVPVTEGTVLTTTPATTRTAHTEPAGPRLPPGFGEGRVLVSNNSRGFPVGLEECEVGVVTGRAYTGVKCGDEDRPLVGHATFDDFPWVIDPGFPFEPGADVVTDPSFPFDEDSPFFESFLDRTTDSDVVVLVAPRGFPFDDDNDDSSDRPTVTTRGVVTLTQPARTNKERKRERSRSNGSASSGDVESNPGKSRTRRSASKKQKAAVNADSRRSKNSNASNSKAKSSKKNKKKGNKRAGKESKKQRAKKEKREKRNRDN
jgi:hypothetical protein